MGVSKNVSRGRISERIERKKAIRRRQKRDKKRIKRKN